MTATCGWKSPHSRRRSSSRQFTGWNMSTSSTRRRGSRKDTCRSSTATSQRRNPTSMLTLSTAT